MEKRTLGSFLAALRKANGMTQRELAERLNVSDKAVSRWERDECAPDLTLIPVIADIFGVTSDELLRGARSERADREDEPERTVRSDKQVDQILKSYETKYRIRSLIAQALLGIGIIVGCGLLNTKWAIFGVLIGSICWLSAAFCLMISTTLAFSAVNTEDFDSRKIQKHRRNITSILGNAILANLAILEVIAVLLDLVFFPTGFGYATAGAIVLLICMLLFPLTLLLWWIIQNRLAKREFCFYTINEMSRLRLKIKTWVIVAILVCVTFAGQYVFNNSTSAITFTKGTTFDNYEDFKAYMETPTNPGALIDHGDELLNDSVTIYPDESVKLPDEESPVPSDDSDTLRDEILDKDGNVLVSYQRKNRSVVRMDFGENTLPITTYSTDQLNQGAIVKQNIIHAINALYLVEVLGGVVVYFIIRNRRERSS